MTDSTIASLTAFTPLTGAEEVELSVPSLGAGLKSRKTTVSAIAAMASGGGYIPHPGFISGQWYSTTGQGAAVAGAAPGANNIMGYPFYLPIARTIQALGARVTTADATPGLFQLALYAFNPTTGFAIGAVLAATGDMSAATVGVKTAAIAGGNVTLQPGWYYAFVCTNSATAVFQQIASSELQNGYIVGSPTLTDLTSNNSGNIVTCYVKVVGTYNVWFSMTGQTFVRQQGPGAFALVFMQNA